MLKNLAIRQVKILYNRELDDLEQDINISVYKSEC